MVTNKKQIIDLLKQNIDKFEKLGIKRVGVFGSFVSGKHTQKSDVDLLIEFQRGQKTFRNFIEAANFTESLLGRNVDLLTPESLSPHLAAYIKKEVEYVQIT